MIRRVCGTCGVALGPPIQTEDTEERISHGICRDCIEAHMAGTGQPMQSFLDDLPAPVFVVNHEARVVAANALARRTVAKEIDEIEGYLGGEVFECHYANEPGGCGHTVHCKSCVIRNTVMQTFETGIPSVRVPACQDLDTLAGPRRVHFLISTEMAGDVVLLFIDEAQPADEPGEQS